MRAFSPSPRTLFALGLGLLVATAIAALLVHGRGPRSAARPATVASTPAPPAAPSASATATAFSATLAWSTPEPTTARLRWGPSGVEPVLWAEPRGRSTRHAFTVFGLAPATAYAAEIDATAADGSRTRLGVSFATQPAPATNAALVHGGVLFVDGSPFFPLMAWEECQSQAATDTADGIDLFAGNSCGTLDSLLGTLRGHALAAGTTSDAPAAGPGLVGSFYPDEADGRGLTAATLPTPPSTGVRFLTLTNHFYSGAAPPAGGRGVYPGLIAKADVVGFDLYPLQEWCRPDRLGEVFDAQRQLAALAAGKPTFQWIEVRQMSCPSVPVTAADIEAESWLAIAGGAEGLGFFPSDWGSGVGAAIGNVATRVRELGPALLQPALPVGLAPAGSPVRASARELDGALYVIAVNPAATPQAVTLRPPDLGDRSLEPLGTSHTLAARGGAVEDVLAPLAVCVYVAPPA